MGFFWITNPKTGESSSINSMKGSWNGTYFWMGSNLRQMCMVILKDLLAVMHLFLGCNLSWRLLYYTLDLPPPTQDASHHQHFIIFSRGSRLLNLHLPILQGGRSKEYKRHELWLKMTHTMYYVFLVRFRWELQATVESPPTMTVPLVMNSAAVQNRRETRSAARCWGDRNPPEAASAIPFYRASWSLRRLWINQLILLLFLECRSQQSLENIILNTWFLFEGDCLEQINKYQFRFGCELNSTVVFLPHQNKHRLDTSQMTWFKSWTFEWSGSHRTAFGSEKMILDNSTGTIDPCSPLLTSN